MTKTEEMLKLQRKENKAWVRYDETRNPDFMRVILKCIQKRSELVYKKLPVADFKLS